MGQDHVLMLIGASILHKSLSLTTHMAVGKDYDYGPELLSHLLKIKEISQN